MDRGAQASGASPRPLVRRRDLARAAGYLLASWLETTSAYGNVRDRPESVPKRSAVRRGASREDTWAATPLTTHGLWIQHSATCAASPPRGFRGSVLGEELDIAWVNVDKARLRQSPGGPAHERDLATPGAPDRPRSHRERRQALAARRRSSLAPRERGGRAIGPAPSAQVADGEHWFDVELASQTLTAYVGDRPVFATLVSTGRGPQGTALRDPQGIHRIWVKLAQRRWTTSENLEADAELRHSGRAVGHVLQARLRLARTFWHRAFGRVQSHGCVNLSPR